MPCNIEWTRLQTISQYVVNTSMRSHVVPPLCGKHAEVLHADMRRSTNMKVVLGQAVIITIVSRAWLTARTVTLPSAVLSNIRLGSRHNEGQGPTIMQVHMRLSLRSERTLPPRPSCTPYSGHATKLSPHRRQHLRSRRHSIGIAESAGWCRQRPQQHHCVVYMCVERSSVYKVVL
jgi:hypothetical protein